MAHVRQKNSNLKCSVSNLSSSLAAAKIDLNLNRRSLGERVGKMNALRKKMAKVSDSCGLLEYPLLVKEYKQMMDEAHAYEEQIAALSNVVNEQRRK